MAIGISSQLCLALIIGIDCGALLLLEKSIWSGANIQSRCVTVYVGLNVPVHHLNLIFATAMSCIWVNHCLWVGWFRRLCNDVYWCVLMSPSDVRDELNQTPLHNSCGVGFWGRANLDLVRYLVERAHCDISEYLTCSYNWYKYFKQFDVLK